VCWVNTHEYKKIKKEIEKRPYHAMIPIDFNNKGFIYLNEAPFFNY